MGYGNTSIETKLNKNLHKFGRKIKKIRHSNLSKYNGDKQKRCIKLQKHDINTVYKNKNNISNYKSFQVEQCQQEQITSLRYSPEYKVSQRIFLKQLAYSDQYKPQTSIIYQQQQQQQQQTRQLYNCYIDTLVIMKMQMEEERNRELIEKLSGIKFEETF